MHIVPFLFTFDQSLVVPAVVCLTSLIENAAPDTFYDIFVLHGPDSDFSSSELSRFALMNSEKCRIQFRQVNGEFVGSYEIRGIPETAYYRLIAPELIPEYDLILYSDVDVIFREDMTPYYQMDIAEHYFGGVDNCSALRPEVQRYLENTLHLDYKKGYYYSGNLLINSRLLLRDGKLNVFRKLGGKAFRQQDMDIINIACNGHIAAMPPSFCLTNFLYELMITRPNEMEKIYGEEEVRHALDSGLIHYNGMKPWKGTCLNMDIWWSYYRRSLCYDEEYTYKFWNGQRNMIQDMSFIRRIKHLMRYPLDMRR